MNKVAVFFVNAWGVVKHFFEWTFNHLKQLFIFGAKERSPKRVKTNKTFPGCCFETYQAGDEKVMKGAYMKWAHVMVDRDDLWTAWVCLSYLGMTDTICVLILDMLACYRVLNFPDYRSGDKIEDPEIVIGTSPFKLEMEICPTKGHYGMLASCDRSCDGRNQFRFEIYRKGHVGMYCAGISGIPRHPFGDPNGYFAKLAFPGPMPFGRTTKIGVARLHTGDWELYINDEKCASKQVDRIYNFNRLNNRMFRIGSRFPMVGDDLVNMFYGTIKNPRLLLWQV